MKCGEMTVLQLSNLVAPSIGTLLPIILPIADQFIQVLKPVLGKLLEN
jgi:hypothetical protein